MNRSCSTIERTASSHKQPLKQRENMEKSQSHMIWLCLLTKKNCVTRRRSLHQIEWLKINRQITLKSFKLRLYTNKKNTNKWITKSKEGKNRMVARWSMEWATLFHSRVPISPLIFAPSQTSLMISLHLSQRTMLAKWARSFALSSVQMGFPADKWTRDIYILTVQPSIHRPHWKYQIIIFPSLSVALSLSLSSVSLSSLIHTHNLIQFWRNRHNWHTHAEREEIERGWRRSVFPPFL